jgi:uncharacterized protein (DUF305 family)
VPPRPVLAALAAALLFLAGSTGYAVGTRSGGPPEPTAADVGFLTDMILHHEQAVEMSSVALTRDGLAPAVRSFVLEVLSDQRYEIGLMEATLRSWGEPVDDADDEAMTWMGAPVREGAMPGMASDADLERLADATGDDAGSLWLAMMTSHHEGGVQMGRAAAQEASDPFVRELAARMARIQAIEINEYEAVRARLALPRPTGLTPVPLHGH